jgi:hypothetical protein
LPFFAQTTASFDPKIWFSRKTPICFAENWQKSLKIVIITSTPILFFHRWYIAADILRGLFETKCIRVKKSFCGFCGTVRQQERERQRERERDQKMI